VDAGKQEQRGINDWLTKIREVQVRIVTVHGVPETPAQKNDQTPKVIFFLDFTVNFCFFSAIFNFFLLNQHNLSHYISSTRNITTV
jgi:hypothetical protein